MIAVIAVIVGSCGFSPVCLPVFISSFQFSLVFVMNYCYYLHMRSAITTKQAYGMSRREKIHEIERKG